MTLRWLRVVIAVAPLAFGLTVASIAGAQESPPPGAVDGGTDAGIVPEHSDWMRGVERGNYPSRTTAATDTGDRRGAKAPREGATVRGSAIGHRAHGNQGPQSDRK